MSQNEETKPEDTPKNEAESLTTNFWKEVENRLNSATNTVNERLLNFYVEEEVSSRAELVKKGFAKAREAKKELQKMKPDMKSRDKDGNLVENWSTDAWDKKQKAVEALTKLEKALNTAMSGKYEDLKKVLG